MSALVQFEGGWPDPVAVSCTGMPAPGVCLLSPAVVSPGGNGLVAVELHTSGATVASRTSRPGSGGSLALAGMLLLPGLGLAAGGRAARRRRLLVALAAAASLLGVACGDGPVPSGPGGAGAVAPGTYAITIHATSAGVERSATVALTVTAR
jgi:hypothetical protein